MDFYEAAKNKINPTFAPYNQSIHSKFNVEFLESQKNLFQKTMFENQGKMTNGLRRTFLMPNYTTSGRNTGGKIDLYDLNARFSHLCFGSDPFRIGIVTMLFEIKDDGQLDITKNKDVINHVIGETPIYQLHEDNHDSGEDEQNIPGISFRTRGFNVSENENGKIHFESPHAMLEKSKHYVENENLTNAFLSSKDNQKWRDKIQTDSSDYVGLVSFNNKLFIIVHCGAAESSRDLYRIAKWYSDNQNISFHQFLSYPFYKIHLHNVVRNACRLAYSFATSCGFILSSKNDHLAHIKDDKVEGYPKMARPFFFQFSNVLSKVKIPYINKNKRGIVQLNVYENLVAKEPSLHIKNPDEKLNTVPMVGFFDRCTPNPLMCLSVYPSDGYNAIEPEKIPSYNVMAFYLDTNIEVEKIPLIEDFFKRAERALGKSKCTGLSKRDILNYVCDNKNSYLPMFISHCGRKNLSYVTQLIINQDYPNKLSSVNDKYPLFLGIPCYAKRETNLSSEVVDPAKTNNKPEEEPNDLKRLKSLFFQQKPETKSNHNEESNSKVNVYNGNNHVKLNNENIKPFNESVKLDQIRVGVLTEPHQFTLLPSCYSQLPASVTKIPK